MGRERDVYSSSFVHFRHFILRKHNQRDVLLWNDKFLSLGLFEKQSRIFSTGFPYYVEKSGIVTYSRADSVVVIATCNGLEGPGVESRWK